MLKRICFILFTIILISTLLAQDLNTPIISKIIDNWIDEDIGRGDLTSSSITEENGNAYWIAKEEGIFCGVEIIKEIFRKIIEIILLFLSYYYNPTCNNWYWK